MKLRSFHDGDDKTRGTVTGGRFLDSYRDRSGFHNVSLLGSLVVYYWLDTLIWRRGFEGVKIKLPPSLYTRTQNRDEVEGTVTLCSLPSLSLALWENQTQSAQTTSRHDVITFLLWLHSLNISSLLVRNITQFL